MNHPMRAVDIHSMHMLIYVLFASLVSAGYLSSASAVENQLVLQGATTEGNRIEIYSELSPLVINRIHSWRIRLLDSNGQSLRVEMRISGGMPEHNHGLPTAPQITDRLENGDYLLEGMRFHMPGHWQLLIELTLPDGMQTAVIDFQL